MRYLRGKTVVLTGASSGMGREIARRLIDSYDCRVIGIGRDVSRLEALSQELACFQGRFSYRVFDVSSREQWLDFAASLQKSGAGIDILYNNAGILPKIDSFRSSAENFDKNF
jgi:NADP-dependent 3-hydroxy acid dehydrogenase YdfG